MKLSRAAPEILLLFAVALLLAPGIASLVRTPYGTSPPQFWLAALYVAAIAWVVLERCVRILGASHAPAQDTVRSSALVVLLVVALVLAMLLPFGGLVVAYYLFGAFPGGSAWVLFNKYVGHMASSASNGYLWVISLCLIVAAVGMSLSRGPSRTPAAEA